MNFAQSFKLALKSLKTSKMRAFLTMLGIIIGVGAVIVILSLGNGMTNMMNSQFEKMGSNLIQVMTYGRGTGGTRDVDVEDLYELVDKYPQYLTGVTPYVSASAKVRYQTENYDRTSVHAGGDSCGGTIPQLHRRGSATECLRHRRLSGADRLPWRRTG